MGMFSGDKKPATHGAADTIIGEKAKFRGEISTSGSLSIDGEFEGKISAAGEVIIAIGGKVVGDVQGGTVIVSGKIDGNISAAQELQITKNGRVHGDLAGGSIIIEEGSSYSGRVKVVGVVAEGEEKTEQIERSYQPDAPQSQMI